MSSRQDKEKSVNVQVLLRCRYLTLPLPLPLPLPPTREGAPLPRPAAVTDPLHSPRPFSDDEVRSSAPQVVTCNDFQREVAVTQTIAGKQFDRIFTFDRVPFPFPCPAPP
jgi:kinesin family member 11